MIINPMLCTKCNKKAVFLKTEIKHDEYNKHLIGILRLECETCGWKSNESDDIEMYKKWIDDENENRN